jgi:hypothetical protein
VRGNTESEITVTADNGPIDGLGEHDVFIIESVDANGASMFGPAASASAALALLSFVPPVWSQGAHIPADAVGARRSAGLFRIVHMHWSTNDAKFQALSQSSAHSKSGPPAN